ADAVRAAALLPGGGVGLRDPDRAAGAGAADPVATDRRLAAGAHPPGEPPAQTDRADRVPPGAHPVTGRLLRPGPPVAGATRGHRPELRSLQPVAVRGEEQRALRLAFGDPPALRVGRGGPR